MTRTRFVTGASRGMGRELSGHLLARGPAQLARAAVPHPATEQENRS
jgi:NAD(P)-dependent dehydrogenase (short-subunit alcohol dehydrogenase family)